MRTIIILFFSLIFTTGHLLAQEVKIDVSDRSLNEVLTDMAVTYELQVSFDDDHLSRYRITLTQTFTDPESAIRTLISNIPLEYEMDGSVIVIFPKSEKMVAGPVMISGQVIDKITHEPLPYSHVILNQRGMATDLKGSFAFSSTDSAYAIRVSHLGYYVLDTLVHGSEPLVFELVPSFIGLTEIEVKNSVVSTSALIGEQAGQMKLNHQVASFLPGFGDNSVFNLLRLQPGILASGEQTNELIIWGSYEGQSKVVFDGFTVYALKNFNDNISAFNPLMAKDIEVFKGGYDARHGDRVGGIVNVTGINGNRVKPAFTLNVNNMTLNSLAEIPLFRNGSLVIAFRTTYYELYNPSDINTRLWRNNDRDTANDVDLNVVPDYRFSDLNVKYSAHIRDRDLFYISLYGGNDRFSYTLEEPLKNVTIFKSTTEGNKQAGGSAFYGRVWKNGSTTNFNFSFSSLESTLSDQLSVKGNGNPHKNDIRDLESLNGIRESSLQIDHRVAAGRNHLLEGGLIFKRNVVELREDTFHVAQAHFDDTASRLILFVQDNISLGNKTVFKAGIRINRSVDLERFYLEPRISLSYAPDESWKLNLAWGIYDQFIARSSVVDDLGNIRYIWTVCDNEDIPVLKSEHLVAGASYNRNEFTFSLEGYFKTTTGLTRFVRNNPYHSEGIFQGKGRGYGMDVMIKKDYRGHSAWVAYSLSRTEEVFEYFLNPDYRRAPQDQRHEAKAAMLLNFDPFFFSADYVYGSGFPAPAYLGMQQPDDLTYSRMDVAFIYKFLDRKLKGEIGLSVLNVLNTQNIKYANFERIPGNQSNSINLYSEAIPITPALYLKLAL